MEILVCIKQVPDTSDIKWSENNTIQREGVESIINPFDEYALETALKIKDKNKSTNITVLSMGPNQAMEAIKEALAMGADEGFLLSDKKFSGSDTYATSKILSSAIQSEYIKKPDLIFCGQNAIDGDTAQTGPSLSKRLNYSLVTCVTEIKEINDGSITVKKSLSEGELTLKVVLPSLICVKKCEFTPRLPLIRDRIKSAKKEIKIINFEMLNLSPEEAGIKGSPTYVSKAFRPQTQKECKLFYFGEENKNEIFEEILNLTQKEAE